MGWIRLMILIRCFDSVLIIPSCGLFLGVRSRGSVLHCAKDEVVGSVLASFCNQRSEPLPVRWSTAWGDPVLLGAPK